MIGKLTPAAARWAWPGALILLATALVVLLVWLHRAETFFHDDWNFVANPERLAWSMDAFMRPYNGHWIAGVALLWKPLLATVGISSYLPYLGTAVLAHVATAAAIYWFAARRAGPLVGLVLGAWFLALGAGNFAPAFLVGFYASVALGTWALVLSLDDPARWQVPIAALLVLAVATSAPGLFFVAAVATAVLLRPGSRRQLWTVLPAGGAYAAWLLVYGRDAVPRAGVGPDVLAAYVGQGIRHAVTSVFSAPGAAGAVVLVAGIAGVALALFLSRHDLPARATAPALVACAVGLVAGYAITGLGRAQLGIEQAEAGRYVYPAASFLLVAVAAIIGLPRPGHRVIALVAVTLVAAHVTVANLPLLRAQIGWAADRAEETRAAVDVLLRYGGSPALPADRHVALSTNPFLKNLPGPDRLRSLFAVYGSPFGEPVAAVSPRTYDQILWMLVRDDFTVSQAPALPQDRVEAVLVASEGAIVSYADRCLVAGSRDEGAVVVVSVPSGRDLYIEAADEGRAAVEVSRSAPPLEVPRPAAPPFTERAGTDLQLAGGTPLRLRLPDVGDAEAWLAGLTVPVPLTICLAQSGSN